MGLIGAYGLLLAFVAACQELGGSWGNLSLWFSDLARGTLNSPPPIIRTTWVDAELTWLLSSILPLMLLGAGLYLCRESLKHLEPRVHP